MRALLPVQLLLLAVAGLLPATLPRAHAAALETGLHYYAVIDLTRGEVVQRGQAGDNGIAFDQLILGPQRPYRILLLQAATFQVAEQSLITPRSGATFKIGRFLLRESRSPDTDRDGLSADAELVMGTDPGNADTDGDGVGDGAEVRDGRDPLSGLAGRTGIIASVATPGPALDVCTLNNLALVALGTSGVSVYNIFAGFDPVSITQVDTPGTALRVACSGTLLGVADGPAGLAVIDLSDPPAAGVTRQVSLGASALSLTTVGFVAFVGLDTGELVAVDMTTGAILSRLWLGARVVDVVFGRRLLYALTENELHTLVFNGNDLETLSTTPSPASATFPNRRLFVGGDRAYATYASGFNVFTLRDPERPLLLTSGRSPSRGWNQIVLNGSGEAVAAVGPNPNPDARADVSIYDVSDPIFTDRLINTYPTPGAAVAVALFNGFAYCADSDAGLQVINYLAPDRAGLAPTIRLETSPAGTLAEEGKIFAAAAEVADDVQVRNVEFHLDGRLVATDGDFPFEYRFIAPAITPGRDRFTLRARAWDTGGNSTWSEEISLKLVADATPPRVARISPPEGALVRDIATLGVVFNEAMNPESIVSHLVLRGAGPDGVFLTADDLAFPSPTFTFPSDPPGAFFALADRLPTGRYRMELSAAATDLAGNALGTAQSTTFTVYRLDEDADGDCVPDGLEVVLGGDPARADSDTDGVADGDEDFDGDGITNCAEIALLGSNPVSADSDGDGIADGLEDADNDGLSDREELLAGADGFRTNPLLADSDGDGVDDGIEVGLGLNPLLAGDTGGDVVVEGRTVSFTGTARLGNLTLRNGAVLTHPPFASAGLVGLTLNVSNLVIDGTSRIDVTGRGYPGGRSGYNSDQDLGRTRGNVAGSSRRNGGSYGGRGAPGDAEQRSNAIYGDPVEPVDLGSGGGSDVGPGGHGGGRVSIQAESLRVDGRIVANGSDGNRYGGGGSGGSIRLAVGTVSGSGVIEARGGTGGAQAGGGGGGRISVVARTATGTLLSQATATGGSGAATGASGTLYLQVGSEPSELIVRGAGRETELPSGNPGGRVILDGSTVSSANVEAVELRLVNGAVLTHAPAGLVTGSRLQLRVDTLAIESGSRIDVSGRGYAGGRSLDASDAGRTLGNAPGSGRRAGGSYGGLGSPGDTGIAPGTIYGNFRDPNELGSGGGSDVNNAGAGGGLVRIEARVVTLHGEVRANGSPGTRYGGGGSGGGIHLQTTRLIGSGQLSADGGVGGAQSGSGGGGRVAVIYSVAEGSVLEQATARPGAQGYGLGAPGTVFLRGDGVVPRLIVRGAGRETPLPEGNLDLDLHLDAATVSARELTVQRLTLVQGATLTHPPSLTTQQFGLRVSATDVALDGTSQVNLTGRGFPGGRQSDNREDSGITFGLTPGSGRRAGGSHAGLGGTGDSEGVNAPTYGDYRQPNQPGGGGGSDVGPAGAGGGVFRLNARSLSLEGALIADGQPGTRYGGGGAGGSVWITVERLAGTGRFSARGGASGAQSGTGGGGRVALHYGAVEGTLLGNLTAESSQEGHSTGAPGTLYLETPSSPPRLIVRGPGRESPIPAGLPHQHLVLDQATASATNLVFADLQLLRGATLTHPPSTLTQAPRLTIASQEVLIDRESRIDLTGRGYRGGRQGDNGNSFGITVGLSPGSGRRAGGSHAGLGGTGDAEGASAPTYGDYRQPDQPGGGGGSDVGPAGAGGGVLRLDARSLSLEGALIADGQPGTRYGGGGAGGSVWVTVERLAGTGRFSARGGAGGSQSGAGGGGRIALHYGAVEGTLAGNLTAESSPAGHSPGAPGTLFLETPSSPPRLIIRGPGRESPIPDGLPHQHLVLDQATASATNLVFAELQLLRGASLTHPPATLTHAPRLDITATRMVIDSESRIDLTGRGYPGGRQLPGMGDHGQSLHHAQGSPRRAGGGYGGTGGMGDVNEPAHEPYGAWNRPNEHGGGGGSDVGAAGSGGGLLVLTAGDLTLDGLITSAGGDGGRYGGGGGGGGLRLALGTLRGSGTLKANGGGAGAQAGSGGGGRISVVYSNAPSFAFDTLEARGGLLGLRQGSPGTIFVAHPGNPLGDLRIDARGTNSPSLPTRLWMSAGRAGTTITVLADRLIDPAAGFVPGALVGLELNPNPTQSRTFTIRSNDTTTLVIDPADGDLRSAAGPGRAYEARFQVGRLQVVGGAHAEWVDADQFRTDRSGVVTAQALDVLGNSVLTHPVAGASNLFGLRLTVGTTAVIDVSSRIDVRARGYLGGRTAGNPADTGRTAGNVPGSTRRVGGSHGGLGGQGDVGGVPAPVHGNPNAPDDLGGGGGSDVGPAGPGGGRVILRANRLEIPGAILADGGDGSRYGGGGAGGTIHLLAEELVGAGTFRAPGGAGGTQSGGGGGGRIAFSIRRTPDPLPTVNVEGAPGATPGAVGTFVLQTPP